MVWYQAIAHHLQGGMTMMAAMGSQGMRGTAYPHRTHLTVVGNNDFCGDNGKEM